MKKLINHPRDVVRESLEGLVLTRPETALMQDRLIIVRTDRVVDDANRATVPVALVSGGGAGHEPAHAGYVASGMLTAAVSGEVFSSPSVDAVLDGIRAVTGDAGCLLIVKSYTGDRLNFGLAAELARTEGHRVEMVVVADDVAIVDSDANAGRRGLAGTIVVHKAAGAAAEAGRPLAEVAAVARSVAAGVGTIGVGLTGVTVPGAAGPGFTLAADEVELGLGIHGEPGVQREMLRPADDLVADLVHRVIADRGIAAGDRVVALVGSAGATPLMELAIVTRAVVTVLSAAGIELVRVWQGPVLTSLDMAGVSVTVLLLPGDAAGAELLELLDAPTSSASWPGRGPAEPPRLRRAPAPAAAPDRQGSTDPDLLVRAAVDAACRALLADEAELTRLDQVVGDGDLGTALARGARAWLEQPIDGSAAQLLRRLSEYARRDIGGTSGPLYAVGLLRTSEALQHGGWAEAFADGVSAISDLGGATVGDRTMVDALWPAAEAAPRGLDAAVEAARRGAAKTAQQVARRGRSSYLGDRVRGHPDPGAVAVAVWLGAVRDALAAPGPLTGQ